MNKHILAHNKYLWSFVIPFVLILIEFHYYLLVEITTNVLLFSALVGLVGAGLTYSKSKGKLHFGVILFMIGFISLLVAGIPLFGNASIEGIHEAFWTIDDENGGKEKKVALAIISIIGLLLIIVNFRAYKRNWTSARPLKK